MSRYTALLDANVLYPAPLRDLLLQLAVTDLFRAKWTADIHREWIEALLRKEPHRDRAALERTRDLMDSHTRDCLVTGYNTLAASLTLPDMDDRHVLAAAITGHCDVIVTQTSTISLPRPLSHTPSTFSTRTNFCAINWIWRRDCFAARRGGSEPDSKTLPTASRNISTP